MHQCTRKSALECYKIISRKKCAQCLGKCTVVQQNDIRHPSAALGCTLGQKNRPSGAARPRADFLPSSAPSGLHWGDGNSYSDGKFLVCESLSLGWGWVGFGGMTLWDARDEVHTNTFYDSIRMDHHPPLIPPSLFVSKANCVFSRLYAQLRTALAWGTAKRAVDGVNNQSGNGSSPSP